MINSGKVYYTLINKINSDLLKIIQNYNINIKDNIFESILYDLRYNTQLINFYLEYKIFEKNEKIFRTSFKDWAIRGTHKTDIYNNFNVNI